MPGIVNWKTQKIWNKIFKNLSYSRFEYYVNLTVLTISSCFTQNMQVSTAKPFLLTSYEMTILIVFALTPVILIWHICSKTVTKKKKWSHIWPENEKRSWFNRVVTLCTPSSLQHLSDCNKNTLENKDWSWLLKLFLDLLLVLRKGFMYQEMLLL